MGVLLFWVFGLLERHIRVGCAGTKEWTGTGRLVVLCNRRTIEIPTVPAPRGCLILIGRKGSKGPHKLVMQPNIQLKQPKVNNRLLMVVEVLELKLPMLGISW